MFLNKKKYLFLLSISLLLSLLVFSGTTYAFTFDQFVDYCGIISNLDEASTDQKTLANWVINNRNTIINRIGSNIYTYDSWQCGIKSSGSGYKYYRLWAMSGGQFNNWSTERYVLNFNNGGTFTNVVYRYEINQWGQDGSYINKDGLIGLISNTIPNFSTINWTGKLWNNVFPSLSLLHYFSRNYNYNDQTIQAFNYTYRNEFAFIDALEGLDDFDYIDLSLSAYDGAETLEGTFYVSTEKNSNRIFDVTLTSDIATIGISTRLLNFQKLYLLTIKAYQNDSLSATLSDYYMAFPYGTSFSGDSIVGSIPNDSYTSQDSTNDIIGSFLNTPSSGEISPIALPSLDLSPSGDTSQNFFSYLLNELDDLFTNNEETYITIPLFNTEYIVTTQDFNVLPDIFKPMFYLFHWFWVGLMILKDVRKMFENLKNGRFEKIGNEDLTANIV